ncbi:MAG: hypothetical protein ACRDZR_19245 [Acidimicrobiales bacterium]
MAAPPPASAPTAPPAPTLPGPHRPSPAGGRTRGLRLARPPEACRDRCGPAASGTAPGDPATLLHELRGDAARRRPVDPGLAGGLREWLEDGVAGAAASFPAGAPPVVVDRRAMAGWPAHPPGARREVTLPRLRAALTAVAFRQLVATGPVDDPVTDALDALSAEEGGSELADVAAGLDPAGRAALRRDLAGAAATMAARWPPVPAGWLPRTGDRLSVPLAGGRVVVVGTADLVLGAPPARRSSVCVVEVRAGGPGTDVHGRRLLALLETLRSGAPPCRVATYHASTGELQVEEPSDRQLGETVQDVVACAVARCRERLGAVA